MIDIPVAFMSFDRPDMLERVIQSVKIQTVVPSIRIHPFLFQDGWINRTSGDHKANPKAIDACIKIFSEYFPEGVVVSEPTNVGVAGNFARAERLFFEEHSFLAAFFLEDDMILQPYYFFVLEQMLNIALANDSIGMFSAYGFSVDTPLSEQIRLSSKVCLMNEHNWAFGITRACCLRRNKLIEDYLLILSQIDYRERGNHHPEIFALQRSLGRGGKGYLSSQDSMKNLACEVLGIHRINSYVNCAQYIGRTGEHMKESRYYERGYHRTILYEGAPPILETPSIDELDGLKLLV